MNLMALAPHYQWLVQMLARLFEAAWNERDPELYAALFLEELPRGIDPNVVGQLLAAEDWALRIISIEPRWNNAQVLPWLEAARGLILQSLSEEQGAHMAQHSVPRPSTSGRGTAEVDVRGPLNTQEPAPAVHPSAGPAPKPSRDASPQGVDRPTKLPSLTGD